jgi:hypothetical protein
MILLLSGEGKSDMGDCTYPAEICTGDYYRPREMAYIVDKLIGLYQGFELSYLDSGVAHFVSKKYLSDHKPNKPAKSLALPGKKKGREENLFFVNARSLAIQAKRLAGEEGAPVLAVLFKDSDGTASSDRGEWRYKRASIIKGFAAESYSLGVAMMPKPKSEAWLICALKDNPYQNCGVLEERSGNDDSPNALKPELEALLVAHPASLSVNELIAENHIDIDRIEMNSMEVFKADLKAAVEKIFPQGNG